jgi:hypothetical protein
MTRIVPLAALVLGVCAGPRAGAQYQPSIVGTWEWTRSANQCSEQYRFRNDGTLSIRSGERRSEDTYRMAWMPESNGRYVVTMKLMRQEGDKGCMENAPGAVGEERIVYVLFGPSRQTMILCDSLSGTDCIGPLKKSGT